jgi:hypothetical protein
MTEKVAVLTTCSQHKKINYLQLDCSLHLILMQILYRENETHQNSVLESIRKCFTAQSHSLLTVNPDIKNHFPYPVAICALDNAMFLILCDVFHRCDLPTSGIKRVFRK